MPYNSSATDVPAVIAHRGASTRYPENSVAAFKEALNIASAYPEIPFVIETDMRATRDGALVLMHDATLDRTTDAHGAVAEASWRELRQVQMRPFDEIRPDPECGRHVSSPSPYPVPFAISESDLRIATLQEAFDLVEQANEQRCDCGGVPAGLALEVKPAHADMPGMSVMQRLLPAAMNVVSLGGEAVEALPVNPNTRLIADFFNRRAADQDEPYVPVRLFGIGPIGHRDIDDVWQAMTPAARHLFYPGEEKGAAPYEHGHYREETVPRPGGGVMASLESAVFNWVSPFWTIGDPLTQQSMTGIGAGRQRLQPFHPETTTLNPVNTPCDMKAALHRDVDMITTEHPEALLQMIRRQQQAVQEPDRQQIQDRQYVGVLATPARKQALG